MCLSVTLHIVDLWQYYICCTRSGITRCTLFMVLFLCRMCRFGLHEVLIAHRYTYAPLRCRISQYSRTFIPLSVSQKPFLLMMNIKHWIDSHLFLHYSIYFKDMFIKSWVQEFKSQISLYFPMKRNMHVYWKTLMQHQVHRDIMKFVICYMRMM